MESTTAERPALIFAIGIVVILIGIYGWRNTTNRDRMALESNDWPSTPGHIIASSKKGVPVPNSDDWMAQVEYRYAVGNNGYTSTRITFARASSLNSGESHQGSYGWVSSVVSKYPVGKSVVVYHDPERPEISVLQPGERPSLRGPVFGIAFGLFVCYGALQALQRKRKREEEARAAERLRIAESSRRSAQPANKRTPYLSNAE